MPLNYFQKHLTLGAHTTWLTNAIAGKRYGAEPRVAVDGVGLGTRVRVWSADPGANATDFMGEGRAELARARGIQGPEEGAKVLVGCVVGERDGEEGRVVGVYGVGPW